MLKGNTLYLSVKTLFAWIVERYGDSAVHVLRKLFYVKCFSDCEYLKVKSSTSFNTNDIVFSNETLGFSNPLVIDLGYQKFEVSFNLNNFYPEICSLCVSEMLIS